jgi:hypothetical protein
MGILIISLIFICRLKLKVKRLKMTLKFDERVEIVLLCGRQVYAVKIRDVRQLRQRITVSCATVDPNMFSKFGTNMVKRLRK